MREAFERAILENPDDVANYSAYADWLQEQGDPRGEFMAVQLALEDESRPKDARDALKAREAELLAAYEAEWLGELVPFVFDRNERGGPTEPLAEHWWSRGQLSELRVQFLTLPLARAVARAPATRFLRKLHVEEAPPHRGADFVGEGGAHPEAFRSALHLELIGAPCLQSLRTFQAGAEEEPSADGFTTGTMYAPGLERLVADMPRVEELYLMCGGYDAQALFALPNLTRLETLRVYGLGDEHEDHFQVPLNALAGNVALGALTHLLVHLLCGTKTYLPLTQVRALVNSRHLTGLSHLQLRLSDMGDDGARAIIESQILRRLGWLDLRNGTMTDYGAKAFADAPLTRNLRRLDLSRNRVTPAGLNLLRRVGVSAVADNIITRREADRREREQREADME